MQKQNPFSLYDFLGYLIPGIIFFYTVYNFTSFGNIFTDFFETKDGFSNFAIVHEVFLIALCYVLGHALSLISSMLIEQFLIYSYGYPSSFLLCKTKIKYLDTATTLKKLGRSLLAVVLFPIFVADWIIIKKLEYTPVTPRPVGDKLKEYLLEKISLFFNNTYASADQFKLDGEIFRVLYHYCLENRPNHVAKFQNYVALYGFTRTMCFVFLVAFWLGLFALLNGGIRFDVFLISLAVHSFLAIVFYFGFIKFYRRFTLEVLMAFAATNSNDSL
jgi:hypothetical protein